MNELRKLSRSRLSALEGITPSNIQNIFNMKKIILFFLLSVFLVYCKNSDHSTYSKEDINNARLIFTTPVRTPEENELLERLEEVMWNGGLSLIDYGYAVQFKLNISREEWKKKKLPDIFYEIYQHDIACSNIGLLDSITFNKKIVLEGFHKQQSEFLSRKGSRHHEPN